MIPTKGQLSQIQDRIIGEIPYEEVAACIPCINDPIEDWPHSKIRVDMPDGRQFRFQQKQFYAIKSPVCEHCRERGVTFMIVTPPQPKNNPNRNVLKKPKIMLVTQHGLLLTRDHIIPQCKGGSHAHSNIQVLCEVCNSDKSQEDCH
jgi:hypothetical protein